MSTHPAEAQAYEPVPFGNQYLLLRLLAVGGMAEIYLARQNAMAGFEKHVVIKRLKPDLAGDPRIVEMFLDEARIGAVLNHPNIVHVYDVDVHDGIPYIAMEYIHGEELNQLCRRGLGLKNFLPLEHAIELIRQSAAGMGYFHHKRGDSGQGKEIVHLDISPTNLLVTEDGFLKIIDFGIARARGQRFRDEGSIPGKLSYMSPEQAARGRVDHRSDIFSLGVVLYEITVGKRLFKGPAAEVVKKLIEAKVPPPTFVRRDFPGPLEAVVMRCLEKHPGDRYQSAYDLADDLEEILRDLRLHSGPVRIARYLDELTHAAGGQRRPELISEDEQAAAEASNDLDFDSKVFDSYQAAEAAPPETPSEWDEFEEGDEGLAEALGMDLDRLRQMRTPVPGRPASGDGGDDDPGAAGGAAQRKVDGGGGLMGGGARREALPLRAPARTPVPSFTPPVESEPVRIVSSAPVPDAGEAPVPVAVAPQLSARTRRALQPLAPSEPDAVIAGPPRSYAPFVVFGGLGVAALAAVLYFLL